MNGLLVSCHWDRHDCFSPISSLSLPRICWQPRCLLVSCQHGSTMTVFLPPVPFLCLIYANNQGVCWFHAIAATMTVFLPSVPFLCLVFADNQSMCSMKRYYCDNPNGKEKCILLPKKSVKADFMIIRILMMVGDNFNSVLFMIIFHILSRSPYKTWWSKC